MTTTSNHNRTHSSISEGQRPAVLPRVSQTYVLVVEDDEDTRFMLRTMLEYRGIVVAEAVDGAMAITIAENMRLDLILINDRLPVLNGFEAMRRIRRLASAAADVPIVFLSCQELPAFKAQAFAAGCDEYIVKPFAFCEIDGALARYVSPSVTHQAIKYPCPAS